MRRTRTASLPLILMLALAAAFGLRCGDNASDPMLQPPASTLAKGTISGTLDWGIAAPWPETVVYAIVSYNASCSSGNSTIHITGTYNNWNEEAWTTEPGMSQVLPCWWVQMLDLESDDSFAWKFVTDAAWDGSYASCGDCDLDADAMLGELKSTNENDIEVPITEDGDYYFLLNASVDPALFRIAIPDEVPWDTVGVDSSSFQIENLAEGIYTLVIETLEDRDQFPRRVIKGIIVSGEEGANLGTIEVAPTGFIAGAVQFGDDPSPRPSCMVRAFFSETGAVAESVALTPADTTFEITGLNEEVYDIEVSAAGYVDSIVAGIAFAPGDEIDLGTITLQRAGSVSGMIAFADDPDRGPAVTVTATYPDSTEPLSGTLSDSTGLFALAGLPPGLVDVHFTASKYRDTTVTDVAIAAGADTDLGTITLQPGCVSVANTIHILGNFNGWDEGLWISDPGMRQVESCIWRDTVVVYPAYAVASELKFVVDGAWGSDYSACPDDPADTLSGPVCLGADGNVLFLGEGVGGRYEFTLDEDSLLYRARVIEEFTGGVAGSIAFDTGLEPPLPAVTVEARRSGETFLLATGGADAGDGTFGLAGLDDGDYDILFTGSSFRDTTISATVSGGAMAGLGEVTLSEVEFQSEFTVIRVVGDFNGWDTMRPSMKQVSPGIWVDTVSVSSVPLCSFMKFRTAEDWGENDYWNCGAEDQTCTTPLSGDVCHGTGTGGNPPAIGKMNFETAGDYEVRLDEINLTYEITLIE